MATKPQDFTGMVEDIIKEESQNIADLIKEELAAVRPVGSSKVTKSEQDAEWQMMKDNPEALAMFFQQQNASVASAIRYAHKMMQRENDGTTGR